MIDDYIYAGFRVFGLYGGDEKGRCECGDDRCKAAFKHPRISNWQHTPEWSDDQLDVMQKSGQFDTGFGVLVDGYLVIDVDARNGGLDSFDKLCKKCGDLLGESGFAVATGSGGGSMHIYYKLADDRKALLQNLSAFPGIDFKSSGYVVGAGSKHASGNTYEKLHGNPDDVTTAPDALLAMLEKPDRHRTHVEGRAVDVSHENIADMLAHYRNDDLDYDSWIKCGMAIHHATGGSGFELWERWSATSKKFDPSDMHKKWHSFGKSSSPVTLGTLIYHAKRGGWKQPVEFAAPDVRVDVTPKGLPFDISGVDLKNPPGLVGQVTQFINSQCRRPRENLAVAGALTAVGNISGLRYTDERDNVTTNLFTFCVAASRTGKEAIQQAVAMLHRAAGVHPASHGAIKSEQEILRNLVRHQAAYYVIDEIGIFLQKIKNAQERGGAVYLDGVIGMLMATYSKADGFMLLTGDMKDSLKKALYQELQQLDDDSSDRSKSILDAIANLDNGLEKPFLSLIGFTTPVTFDNLVDYQSATNGFIGRALLFNERETVPAAKRRFRREPMPETLKRSLINLYDAGSFSGIQRRIEFTGERVPVPATDEAHEMLDAVLDWFEEQAVIHKGLTGLEALSLGAYELVAKVALILGVAEGLITAEHVRWAFALVRRDVDEKTRLVTANDREKDSPAMALRARISNVIDSETGETMAVICNRIRNRSREDLQRMLDLMIENGQAEKLEGEHSGNRKPVIRFRLVAA